MPEIRLSNEPAERLQKGRSGLGINVEMPPESRNVGNSQGGNQYSMEHSMDAHTRIVSPEIEAIPVFETFMEYSLKTSMEDLIECSIISTM